MGKKVHFIGEINALSLDHCNLGLLKPLVRKLILICVLLEKHTDICLVDNSMHELWCASLYQQFLQAQGQEDSTSTLAVWVQYRITLVVKAKANCRCWSFAAETDCCNMLAQKENVLDAKLYFLTFSSLQCSYDSYCSKSVSSSLDAILETINKSALALY